MSGEDKLVAGGEIALGSLLTRIEAGKSPSAEDSPAGESEWGVLKVSAIQAGRFASRENKVIRDAALIHRRYEVKHGDLLMTRANTEELVGLACVAENPPPRLLLSDKTLRLHVDASIADPRFLQLVLAQRTVRQSVRALATGTSAGMKNIRQEQIQQLEVPNVPLAEQHQIVAVHAAFERRIGALEGVAVKRAQLLDALIEQLLGAGSGTFSSLKDAEVSINAGITLGSHRVPSLRPAGYLRVANVRKGWIEGRIALLEAMERDHHRYSLTAGDLLVVEGHADPEQIGRCAIVGADQIGLLYQNHLFRLRFDSTLPEFAMLWLNSRTVRNYWKSQCATSSGLYTINSKLLEGVPFPRMGLGEQERIVGVWKAENQAARLLNQRIAKMRKVQRGVVEDLLISRSKAHAT
jgi:type I restriction enzyme S subunit